MTIEVSTDNPNYEVYRRQQERKRNEQAPYDYDTYVKALRDSGLVEERRKERSGE